MAGLLEGVNKFKHVWKTLDAVRETGSLPHNIEMDDSIDAAIASFRVIDDTIAILSKKSEQRDKFAMTDIDNIISDLKNSTAKLQTTLLLSDGSKLRNKIESG